MLTIMLGSMVAQAHNQCAAPHTGPTLAVPVDYPTITDAVSAANNGDVILIDPGTYAESVDLLGKSLTLQGAGCGQTTLFTANGPGLTIESSKTTVHDMTIRGANTFRGAHVQDSTVLFERVCFDELGANGGGIVQGAGIDGYDSDMCLRESQFVGNEAMSGGGVHVQNGPSNYLQIEGSTFLRNLALAGYGGGVRQTGGTLFMENNDLGANKAVKKGGGVWTDASDAIVVDTVFSGNTALGGGGMSFFGGTLLHKRGSFDTNIADFGGGLEIGFAASSAFIVDTLFQANQAQLNNGAALWVDGTDLELEGITFANNVAVHLGGGLYQWREGSLTVRTSTFSDNEARAGGAISYDSRNVGTLVSDVSIEDSLFERNLANPSMAAVAEGGALQIARARNLTVRRSLFHDNLATAGSTQRGGTLRLVFNDHTTVEDSFLCGGSAANGGAVHTDRSGVQDSWHNNIFVNNSATTHGAAVVFNEPAGVDFTHNTVVNNDGDRTAALLFTLASGASANTDQNVVAYSDASAILPGVGAIGAWDATTESIVDSGWGTNYCHANQPDDFTSIFTGPPSCTDPGTDPLPGSDPDPMDCDSFGQSDFVLDSAFAGAGADPTNIPLP